MSKKVSRRKFIAGAAIGGLSLYVGGWWLFKVRKGDASNIIISIIKKKLDYLDLDEDGLKSFASDFQNRLSERLRYWGSWAGILAPVYSIYDIFKFTPQSKRFKGFEVDIVSQYLLSSDFFVYDADMNRTVKYLQYYDPYETGCANPFAEF